MFSAILNKLPPSKVSSLIVKRRGSSIPVILLNELPSKGNAGEVISVKRGYARNHLIPKKIAAYATKDNRDKYQQLISHAKAAAKGSDSSISSSSEGKLVAAVINVALEQFAASNALNIAVDSAESNTLYAALSEAAVLDQLSNEHNIVGNSVKFGQPIKALGEYFILVDNVSLRIKVTSRSSSAQIL